MATISSTTKFAKTFLRFKTIVIDEMNDVYKQKLKRKQEEIIEKIKEKSSKALQSEIAQKMRVAKGYYKLEMSPPKIAEMQQLREDVNLVKDFIKSGCFEHLTIKQAWLLFLVGTEIGLWFFFGETIGKMHIIGYKV